MQPFDYRIAVQDPLQMALAGYQQGQQFQQQRVQGEREAQLYDMEMQQYQANQAKLQEEQARAQAMQRDFADFAEGLSSGTRTIDDVIRLSGLYPEIAEQVQSTYQMKTEVQKNNEIKETLSLASLLRNAPEAGAEKLKESIAAAEAAGDQQRFAALKNVEASIGVSPDAPVAAAIFTLFNVMPADQFKLASEQLGLAPEKVPDSFRADQMRAEAAGLVPDTPEYQEFMRQSGGGQTINVTSGLELSPGFKKRDELFAEKALEWDTGGGVDALKQLTQIEDVIGRIDRGENISGGVAGFAPDVVRAFVDPNAQDAKDTVEEVVQRNLKAVLGAQFAQNEGAELIKRAFNPKLSPEINRKRLQRLFTQMRLAGEQRKAMVEYFNTNGTLQGYAGRQPSAADFYAAIEGQAPAAGGGTTTGPQPGTVEDGFVFQGGDPADPNNWKLQ